MNWHAIEVFLQDLRFAARQLKHNLILSTVIILSLALGIGVTTAVYGIVDAVLLRSLPIQHSDELAILHWVCQKRPSRQFAASLNGIVQRDTAGRLTMPSFSYPMFTLFRSRHDLFTDVLAIAPGQTNVSHSGKIETAKVDVVSSNYFAQLGVSAAAGRVFSDADRNLGTPLMVLSFDYWLREFGGLETVVGSSILVHKTPYVVIGVAARGFRGLDPGRAPDFWVPINLAMDPQIAEIQASNGEALLGSTGIWWLELVARLHSGVSIERASAQLDTVFLQQLGASSPAFHAEEIPHIYMTEGNKGLDTLREEFGRPTYILAAGCLLVLLAACANAAMLLLARSTNRRRELAVRQALGASRFRILQQLLTEIVLLVLTAGILGLVLSHWMIHLLVRLVARGQVPVDLQAGMNASVIGFGVALCVAISLILAMLVATQAIQSEIEPFLKQRAVVGNYAPKFLTGRLLIVAQLGASLMLITGAGLFLRTMQNLQKENLGFNQKHLLIFTLNPETAGYDAPRTTTLFKTLQQRIAVLPGVSSASFSKIALVSGYWSAGQISIPDRPPVPGQSQTAWRNMVGPDFFATMGIRVVLGRDILSSDTESSPKVAVINEAMRKEFWDGRNPIGELLTFNDLPDNLGKFSIVGVVANAKYSDVRTDSPPTVYLPAVQAGESSSEMHFEVRTEQDPKTIVASLRTAVQQIDPAISLFDVRTQTEQIESSLIEERLFARAASLFGIFALLIVSIGVYGLSAYSVSQKLKYIGIKLALGASRGRILREIMFDTLLLVVLGGALGFLCSLAVNRFIAALLFQLSPFDPISVFVSLAILSLIAIATTYPAARRASSVDPTYTLRQE